MKTVYLIGGTMGTGKTTVCKILKNKLDNCVFLDGDWCWDMHPFQVTEETKNMVLDNICYMLNNFIHCSVYEHILFCWVMHEQFILDEILARLDSRACTVRCISLICDERTLKAHLRADIQAGKRTEDCIEKSVPRIALYEKLNTQKVDVSDCTPEEAADLILRKS